ncbi:hypothetical protein N473_02495 [Pseudoalteromonas luteoviolacea CPMOR-1]|uniref:Cytochrome c domain-containing protein n=1 Tax=Pseudoalteromonas luteoviolacea CPMOR-1 TaxID=1365248 RepID=A0A161YGS1_9GAMM|nr:hypothetical protein [Pseudoalteromonas luteoviolacea]KZN59801.1 hypothetical protein N473_02495 [Pseudoalteromonas luteoviolacea CPMOR-1]
MLRLGSFILLLTIGISCSAANTLPNHQLPTIDCKGYATITKEPSPCFPAAIGGGQVGNDQGFLTYSLKQFYAINWPTKESKIVTAPNYSSKNYQPFWFNWPSYDANNGNFYLPSNKKQIQKIINERCIRADLPSQFHKLDDKAPLLIVSPAKNPQGEALYDSQNKPVYYKTHLNSAANHSFSQSSINTPLKLPAGSDNGSLQKRGAIILKSAWKLVDEKDPHNYITTPALIISEQSEHKCNVEELALIGLHVASKMAPLRYSEHFYQYTTPNKRSFLNASSWSWATYEHKFNAPTINNLADLDSSKRNYWSLFNAKNVNFSTAEKTCFGSDGNFDLSLKAQAKCILNKPLSSGTAITRLKQQNRAIKMEDVSLESCKKCVELDQNGNYVKQCDYLDNTACKPVFDAKNSSYKHLKILSNYILGDVQWVDSRGVPRPIVTKQGEALLRNTALEPFTLDSNCVSCHVNAQIGDFMFTLMVR